MDRVPFRAFPLRLLPSHHPSSESVTCVDLWWQPLSASVRNLEEFWWNLGATVTAVFAHGILLTDCHPMISMYWAKLVLWNSVADSLRPEFDAGLCLGLLDLVAFIKKCVSIPKTHVDAELPTVFNCSQSNNGPAAICRKGVLYHFRGNYEWLESLHSVFWAFVCAQIFYNPLEGKHLQHFLQGSLPGVMHIHIRIPTAQVLSTLPFMAPLPTRRQQCPHIINIRTRSENQRTCLKRRTPPGKIRCGAPFLILLMLHIIRCVIGLLKLI